MGARAGGQASGRFIARVGPDLHDALRSAAHAEGVSLNSYCVRVLSSVRGGVMPPEAEGTVGRAMRLFGAGLVGLAVFGSWARGETADDSDVDVLVVVDPDVRLSRALYREWDEAPVTWGRRAVEPHFVHLPPDDSPVSGLWAEVAMDGIVIDDTHLRLSRCLVGMRTRVLAGRLTRRSVHGQPFWVEEPADAQP